MDFYNSYDPLKVTVLDKKAYERYLKNLNADEKSLLESGYNYYALELSNIGGLVMPIILEFKFKDGTSEVVYTPVEIWQKRSDKVSKIFFFKKEVVNITVDPYLETADTDRNNNYWPPRQEPTRFDIYKRNNRKKDNTMQRAKKMEKMKK